MQQRQQSRSPLDTNRKKREHQNCQLELGGPENQGCIRLPNSKQVEMPWSIICLQEIVCETYKPDCGANYANAPKMLGALRAPAFALKKNVTSNSVE